MDIFKSLTQVSTNYSVFEKDQVLTHDQLNSIAGFFDDQTRLTRVKLLGVGIVCGLRISMLGNVLKVGRGAGVTSDGDLLCFQNDTLFDKFKVYDASNPRYAPFYAEESSITLYELVQQDVTDVRASSLSQFNVQTGKNLSDMTAILYMESYVTDRDICSGTDCDNLGQDFINNIKLLLIERATAGLLQNNIDTPAAAFSSLNEIVVERPLIPSSVNSLNQLTKIYRDTCNVIHSRLVGELPDIYAKCSSFLSDVFPSDPAPVWNSTLIRINDEFRSNDSGIQYYYDFLKDIAETYNSFRELLFGDDTYCCPDISAFPKHLLLGNFVTGADQAENDENRTGYYPSPIVSRTEENLRHAKFLARKINTLIQSFKPPASTGKAVRITPGMFEDQPLEERAIPYYYYVNSTDPVHKNWNYRLHQQGRDSGNYSYNASRKPGEGEYQAEGGAAFPLTSQISRFSFFRIEGHIGQNVSTVLSRIEDEIKSKNLPFTVCSVMLGSEKGKVVKRPGIRYTDLHRFHYVLRQDLFHQLNEVEQFSGNFKKQVFDSVAEESDSVTLKNSADQSDNTVKEKAGSSRRILNLNYSRYKADPSWKTDVGVAMKAAGEFKYNLGNVVKTEFPTPFDSFITNTHAQWLDWLDQIIKKRDDKEDEKLLFTSFIARHPGIEHFGGVVRGGTFVLVYDDSLNVTADFMLPYYCCDTAEEEDEEPELVKPGIRPGWIAGNGIKIIPSRDKFIKDIDGFVKNRLDTFKGEHIDALQKDYFTGIKESLNLMGNALITKGVKGVEGVSAGAYSDMGLEQRINNARDKKRDIEYANNKSKQPDLPEEKRKIYEDMAKEAEADLADAVTDTTRYVAEKGIDISMGSEGMSAMIEINQGLDTITHPEALEKVTTNLSAIRDTTKDSGLNLLLNNMVIRKTK